jgi:hypothetical protein
MEGSGRSQLKVSPQTLFGKTEEDKRLRSLCSVSRMSSESETS